VVATIPNVTSTTPLACAIELGSTWHSPQASGLALEPAGGLTWR
jgi:hypothetical protein